jgi:YegS/Rv2252/BmrU family lipid kinase
MPQRSDKERRQLKADLERKIRTERRAVLVINARSRQGARSYEDAKRLLTHRGFCLAEDCALCDPARLPEVVAQAVAGGNQLVIVGGGDGTISAVVDSFAYRDVVLGLLPLGTANSFARGLGIPLNLPDAVEVLANGRVADVDLGLANEGYFANSLAIGLPAQIARAAPDRLKKVLGRAGYVVSAALKSASFRPFRCSVTAAGKTAQSFKSVVEVRVANGPYTGGILAAPEASVESRNLVMHIVKGQSRIALAINWLAIAAGRIPNDRDMETITATKFSLETVPAQYVSIDGEPATQTPLQLTIARQALNIIVPRQRDDIT